MTIDNNNNNTDKMISVAYENYQFNITMTSTHFHITATNQQTKELYENKYNISDEINWSFIFQRLSEQKYKLKYEKEKVRKTIKVSIELL